jgi:acetyl-CoA carboxylase biotin carboxyl carrier protein
MTRRHARQTRVISETQGSRIDLRAPMPGHFIPEISAGDLVSPDERIGYLVVLGREIELLAGNLRGLAAGGDEHGPGAPRAVAYGERLLAIDLEATVGGAAVAIETQTAGVTGNAFRAPTSGRYYGRPAPDKPPFLVAGAEIDKGATVCMLEVMKTFNRVIYDGERARVPELLVADGADVSSGDPLLALDPI